MTQKLRQILRCKKGQGLVEYAFIVAGVAFICLLALSVFGHKLSDQYAIMAGMLPGAHEEDNLPVAAQSFLQTDENEAGDAIISTGGISWLSITGGNPTDFEGELQNNVLTQETQGGDAFVAD